MSCYGPMPGELALPELPDGLEWVVHAEHDRFTIHLSTCPKKGEPVVEDPDATSDKPINRGYIMSHTHRHQTIITQVEWEEEVCNTAKHLLNCYESGISHAQWADSIMRRSR